MSDSRLLRRLVLIITGLATRRPGRQPFVPKHWRPDRVAINHLRLIEENRRATFL